MCLSTTIPTVTPTAMLQSGAAKVSLGFNDDELESLADTVAAYCPLQLKQKSTTKFCDTFAALLCISFILGHL